MGVYRTDYLFYGLDVGCDNVSFDRDEDVICGMPGAPFDMVYDGMSGKYAMAGKIIAQSDPHDDGIGFHEITPELLPDKREIKAAIEARFGPQGGPLRLFLFSHFS